MIGTSAMNLATLAKSQTLATVLQALNPATGLAAGGTVEARLLALAGDGAATAQIGDATISLVLAGPEARQAALSPGALLLLKLIPAEQPGAPLRATLLEIRPAPPASTQAIAPSSPNLPNLVNVTPAGQAASAPPGAAASLPAIANSRAAAGSLLGGALANQGSLAPLLANLRGLAQGSVGSVVPRPLMVLANQILAQALPVEGRPVTSEALQQAVARSGLFMEAHQREGQAASPNTDLKAGLVALREALEPMLAKLGATADSKPTPETTSSQSNQQARPVPPRRDGPLALQPIAEPTLHAGEKPLVVAETLLRQTDAALDRIALSQYASLPLDAARGDASSTQRWLTEVPLAFQAGAAMLPLQIEREPPKRGASGTQGPLWRVRFALDVEPMGPLQGVVTLQGRSVGVTLWAEREETSRLLRGAAPSLEAALADAQFENGAIDIHTGQPRVMQATAGQFLDRLS